MYRSTIISPLFITVLVALAALFLACALVLAEWLIRRRDGRSERGDDSAAG